MAATLRFHMEAISQALRAGEAMSTVANLLKRMDGLLPEAVDLATHRGPSNPIWSLMRMPRPTVLASPLQEADRINANRRSAFLINVLRRVSHAGPSPVAMARQLSRETAYAQQHKAASDKRELAARLVAGQMEKYGPILGWLAVMDAKTSRECRLAHGRNFDARHMPAIGYPGAVHPSCRCTAGERWPGNGKVSDVKPDSWAWADK